MKTQHTLSAADQFAAASVSTEPDRGVYPDTKSNYKISMAVKILYTAFMAVLVPVSWSKYVVTNFLYFCDVALFLTLVGVWWEKRILLRWPPWESFCHRCFGWRISRETSPVFSSPV